MKVISWNVNSLNVRLPHVLELLVKHQPDVLALQETKVPDEKFPQVEIEQAGYQVVFSGQKTYNGVAILSRQAASDYVLEIPGLDDPQRRILAATVNGIRIINVYIPNGQEVDSEKYAYKFRWLNAFRDYLQQEMTEHKQLIVLGDYNIAPADLDVHDPDRWQGKIMCSTAERDMFQSLIDLGLTDAVRQLHQNKSIFSWWDYRMNAFRRGWGLRIDHVLASAAMQAVEAGVDADFRTLERPSDHAPVWASFGGSSMGRTDTLTISEHP
jgi:exodeoxyribonuclease-3